jgi:hypothetical protein
MNFKNPKEVFVPHGQKKKKFSQFFHRCHHLGESKPSSSPSVSVFHFSVTVLILQGLFRRDGGEFDKTKGVFCPTHAHIK